MLPDPEFCGIVLCGGQSSRMGRDKATLPFGDRTMLECVVDVLSSMSTCRSIVVVAADGQVLPAFRKNVTVIVDRSPNNGPLEGFAAGLLKVTELFPNQPDLRCFLTSCDVPQLQSAFVGLLLQNLDDKFEAVVPHHNDFAQPLAAAYRTKVLSSVLNLLSRGERSMKSLLATQKVRTISAELLQAVDPQLLSLRNINTPEQYAAAVAALSDGRP